MTGLGSLLRFLLSTGTAIAETAVDAAVDVVNITRPGFLKLPRNISEALKWLAHCGSDNKNGLEQALKKLLGANNTTEIEKFLGKLNEDSPPGIYKNAKWEDLCKKQGSGTSCCASTSGAGCSHCKSNGNCDGCCYDCPQIICARMFCLILPIVYYFLEFLSEKCKYEWASQKLDGSGGQGKDLGNFMKACGFDTSELQNVGGQEINDELEEILEAINKVKEELKNSIKNTNSLNSSLATTSHKEGTKEPSTIREMMLWLQGLPYCPQFYQLKEKIKTQCEKLKGGNGVTCDKVLENLFETVFSLPGMFLSVEGKFSHLLRDLLEGCFGKTPSQCYRYKDGDGLLQQFCEYTYKVHTQLRFLMTMCNTKNDEGGWDMCKFGNGVNGKAKTGQGGHTCSCKGTNANGCSQPLKAFLTNNSGSSESNGAYQNGICMGFDSTKLTKRSPIGWDLYYIANKLIDPIDTSSQSTSSKPLSLLTQYCVAIGQLHPSSLGDLFAFFAHLGHSWDSLGLYGPDGGQKFKDKLEKELTDYKIGQNGDQKQACDQLKTAIKAILNSEHSSHDSKKSLVSLMCTNNTNGCAPYMKSLSQGMYHYYCAQITGAGSTEKFGVFQYLYDMLRKLLDKMKALKDAFEKCPCCTTGSSGTPCSDLISCPNAHPILYKFGFVFGDAEKLKNNNKTCTDIKAQLGVVLQCEKGSESTLFSAFECVIQVTYSILLQKAKGKVNGIYNTSTNGDTPASGLKSTNQEMNTAFTLYVTNAMYDSYPKLICTFACKVFDGKHRCEDNKCEERFKQKIQPPTKTIPSSPSSITVTSTAVTTITAVIPQYTAPVIDRYHYKAFQKTTTDGKSSATYNFQSALDFHVKGANCISPAPVSLRSVIDWILRVTTGATATGAIATQDGNKDGNNSNEQIKHLSEAVKTVFKESVSVSITDSDKLQSCLTALVEGLRKFMGYEDKSQSVKTNVTTVLGDGANGNGTNGVKGALKGKIEVLNKFIGESGKNEFGSELGKALMKGEYAFKQTDALETLVDIAATLADTLLGSDAKKNIHVRKNFNDAVKTFTEILSSTHEGCKELNCKSINTSDASKSDEQNDGLKILKEFLDHMAKYVTERIKWTNTGHLGDKECALVFKQLEKAERDVQSDNGNNQKLCAKYFSILLKALTDIGECCKRMSDLITPNGKINNSSDYRSKIDELKKALEKAIEELTEKDGEKGSKADVRCAVSAATALIKKTKEKTKEEITERIKMGLKNHYDNHNKTNNKIIIKKIIASVEGALRSYMTQYQHHLDDLKQLCQWLYRMSQLYAHGLKGFVESLVKHLEHIIQVIKWIEKLKLYMTIVMNSNNAEAAEVQQSITAGASTIAKLLSSYVLKDADKSLKITGDNASTYRGFLHDLRLLALDRYTLQVWQDECNKNAKDCRIKDWITFENGIIRHSDLNAIREALHTLTGVAYNNASPAPPSPSRSRIHNFHAICVIQKFSYEAPIAELERSLKELLKIQGQLSEVKVKCQNGQQLHTASEITSFCTAVAQFLKDPYGIYSFAKFVHTIMGPNIFSAVIGALEELEEANKYQNGGNGKLDKIKGILEVMTQGLEGENHYKLESIITKLNNFITTLRKEYIFCYPVVTCKAQTKVVAAAQPQPQALATTASTTTATAILDRLKNVMPPCPRDFHNESSVCNSCYNIFAYIFLGQVPKLYHSFRFMSWMLDNGWKVDEQAKSKYSSNPSQNPVNSKITAYLVSMGYDIGNIQSGNQSPGAVNTQLHETFKSAVSGFKQNASTSPSSTTTYEPKGLKEIHDKLEQLLKKLIEKEHTNALQSIAKGSTDRRRRPRTIREMLHWLSGVPFSVVYSEMQTFSNSLCDLTQAFDNTTQKMIHNIKPEPIEYRLGVSCAECLDVLQAVEDPLGKEPQKRYREYIATHDFYYPASASQLFYMFVDIIYNVYVQMKFVCNMTGRGKTEGGWERCEFVRDDIKVVQQYNKKNIQCQCNLNFVEYTCPGPLRRLLSSVSTVFTGRSLGFQLPKDYRYNAPLVGSAIHNVIKHIFGSGNNYSIVCRLLLAVSSCPPTSIGDMICFLYWYRQALFEDKGGQNNAQKYKNALHQEIELFPGTFKPSILTNALGALMKEHTGAGRTAAGGTTHNHNANMLSILDCYGNAEVKAQPQPQAQSQAQSPQAQQPSDPSVTCAPYLRPLAYDIYKIYVPQFSRAYLSWILHFGPRVYTALEEIKGKLNVDCTHCTTNNSIVTCNAVLPELYSKGLDFCDPKVLNGQRKDSNGAYQTAVPDARKTCTLFATQLDAVLTTCSPGDPKSPGAPLHRLIEAIEQFLWSIRMPFSLVQLSLWSVAILFISYVFVVPLDHFKIKSHLFNRLKYTMHPSLLIADQQRRVSEVAYFSL